MLYNPNPHTPGKLRVRDNIRRLWDDCNTELFVRMLLHECNTDIKTTKDLLDFINDKRLQCDDAQFLTYPITVLFDNLEPIFQKITISRLMDACLDKLSILNKKMFSDKFIIDQGIWLTDEEMVDLVERDTYGRPRNRMEVIKERLSIDPEVRLRITPNGLSYAEFRSIVQLGTFNKISTLPTTTLKTLRDKLLLLLDNDLDYHINKWMRLMNSILKAAEARNLVLKTKSA